METTQVFNSLFAAEMYTDKNGRLLPETVYVSGAAGSSGNVAVTGVSGKRILVLYAAITSVTTTATRVYFTSDTGGGARGLCLVSVPANNTEDPNTILGPAPFGVLHADAGESLAFSVNAAAGADVSLTYIIYTP